MVSAKEDLQRTKEFAERFVDLMNREGFYGPKSTAKSNIPTAIGNLVHIANHLASYDDPKKREARFHGYVTHEDVYHFIFPGVWPYDQYHPKYQPEDLYRVLCTLKYGNSWNEPPVTDEEKDLHYSTRVIAPDIRPICEKNGPYGEIFDVASTMEHDATYVIPHVYVPFVQAFLDAAVKLSQLGSEKEQLAYICAALDRNLQEKPLNTATSAQKHGRAAQNQQVELS